MVVGEGGVVGEAMKSCESEEGEDRQRHGAASLSASTSAENSRRLCLVLPA